MFWKIKCISSTLEISEKSFDFYEVIFDKRCCMNRDGVCEFSHTSIFFLNKCLLNTLWVFFTHIRTHTHICPHMHSRTHTHTHTNTHMHAHSLTNTHIHTRSHTQMHNHSLTHTITCTDTHIYTHTFTHTCKHTRIHTHLHNQSICLKINTFSHLLTIYVCVCVFPTRATLKLIYSSELPDGHAHPNQTKTIIA